jgi:hypothetical protein
MGFVSPGRYSFETICSDTSNPDLHGRRSAWRYPTGIVGQSRYNHGMATQNYSNHVRLVPGFHFVLATILFLTLIGSLINLYMSHGDHVRFHTSLLVVVLTVCCGMLFYYTRTFALKAQDRAIRAEENLRHFALTGKLLDARLGHAPNHRAALRAGSRICRSRQDSGRAQHARRRHQARHQELEGRRL